MRKRKEERGVEKEEREWRKSKKERGIWKEEWRKMKEKREKKKEELFYQYNNY